MLVITGGTIACYGLFYWYRLSFGPVLGETLIRIVCAASVLMSIGFQLIFSSFFMYLLSQQPTPAVPVSQAAPTPIRHFNQDSFRETSESGR
jgi:hypothetical protein